MEKQPLFQTPATQRYLAANEPALTPRFFRLRLVRWLWLLFGVLVSAGIGLGWLYLRASGG